MQALPVAILKTGETGARVHWRPAFYIAAMALMLGYIAAHSIPTLKPPQSNGTGYALFGFSDSRNGSDRSDRLYVGAGRERFCSL